MKKLHYTAAVFLPELACPARCVYCNQSSISGRKSIPNTEEIIDSVEKQLSGFPSKKRDADLQREIAFFGGSFTSLPLVEQEKLLALGARYLRSDRVDSLRISTRPDMITDENLRLLKSYGVNCIELGVQSLDREVLQRSGRHYQADVVAKAAKQIKKNGFRLGMQMMIGLPGDSWQKSLHTARRIIEWGADSTRIYPCLVLKSTALADLYRRGAYRPLALKAALSWSRKLIQIFRLHGINILRVGLHPSRELSSEQGNILAGPWHPSFGQLALSEFYRKKIFTLFNKEIAVLLAKAKLNKAEEIRIYTAKDKKVFAVGYASANRLFLERLVSRLAGHYVDEAALLGKEKIPRIKFLEKIDLEDDEIAFDIA